MQLSFSIPRPDGWFNDLISKRGGAEWLGLAT
jgi:hypothetical protein